MKLIKSTTFKSYTTTSKVDGQHYVIPADAGEPILVSDEVAAGFQSEFLHEVDVTESPVAPAEQSAAVEPTE
jgi:hypothetical protein